MTDCSHDEAAAEAMAARLLLIAFDEKDAHDISFAAWRVGFDVGAAGACLTCLFSVAVCLARWYAADCGGADERERAARWLTSRIVSLQSSGGEA